MDADSIDKRRSVGVVVPCHNNALQLYALLRSLIVQDDPPEEIVVIDDNSYASELYEIVRLARTHKCQYARLPEPNTASEELGRRSLARNIGTKLLGTDIVLYLDGDMILDKRYIAETRSIHSTHRRCYVRGHRLSVSEVKQQKGIEHILLELNEQSLPKSELFLDYVLKDHHDLMSVGRGGVFLDRWDWCASNNLSVCKEDIVNIGGWDERYVGWGEEDMDFSYRLFRSGLLPLRASSEAASAYHLDHHIDRVNNRRTLEKNAILLLAKYPQVTIRRRRAYERYDLKVQDLEWQANTLRNSK